MILLPAIRIPPTIVQPGQSFELPVIKPPKDEFLVEVVSIAVAFTPGIGVNQELNMVVEYYDGHIQNLVFNLWDIALGNITESENYPFFTPGLYVSDQLINGSTWRYHGRGAFREFRARIVNKNPYPIEMTGVVLASLTRFESWMLQLGR